jgi:transposase
MATKSSPATAKSPPSRRQFTDEFRREAVQMLLDGHAAPDVADRLGLSGPGLLYRWKAQHLRRSGPVATALDDRVRRLEAELLRVTRERDVLKKALAIFGRHE